MKGVDPRWNNKGKVSRKEVTSVLLFQPFLTSQCLSQNIVAKLDICKSFIARYKDEFGCIL